MAINNLPQSIQHKDPFKEFAQWFKWAQDAKTIHPDNMTLATVSDDGKPSARIVLFKGFLRDAFTFYTNYESDKGYQLMAHPDAALVFYWPTIYRQVRVEGHVEKMIHAESEKYFATRSRDSQLGAWASKQSHVISGNDELERHFDEAEEKFKGKDVPCPPFWGGYRLVPRKIEFWIGREARLHYRFLFELKNGSWVISQLSP